MLESPLTPVLFLDRAAFVFADRIAIIDQDKQFTYAEFGERVHRVAGMLLDIGICAGDRVAALCTNSHVMLELHNGVPLMGAVLVPINIRLSTGEIAYIIEHSGSRLLVATEELRDAAQEVSERTGVQLLSAAEYERRLAASRKCMATPMDERSLLAINYTSGTTGRSKGVMYSHRGAYLQSLAVAYHSGLGVESSYLWLVPMFHCDGWCFTWAVTAADATHICQRQIDAVNIWSTVCRLGVTHMSAAPTLLSLIAEAADAMPDFRLEQQIHVQTGGSPPSPALLARLARLNMSVTHMYGLTETYGPALVNIWQPAWSEKSFEERSRLNARQRVPNIVTQGVRVVDSTGHDVPADAKTLGEIVVRGSNVMLGYYRDEEATRSALIDGWFRTGDLGICHPDGYIEIKDRAKDILITGGENVASVEIERVLIEHSAVLEVAVVGRTDSRWGEVPVAFVALRPGKSATEDELIGFVRSRIAHFKVPKEIRFGELPKTSTGKIRKRDLRARLAASPASGQHTAEQPE